MQIYSNQEHKIQLARFPATTDRSLKPWSAAEEHLAQYVQENHSGNRKIIISHDRFGLLTCLFHDRQPTSVIVLKSQEIAIHNNLKNNNLPSDKINFISPLDTLSQTFDLGLLRVPKSQDLFWLYLTQMSRCLAPDGEVIAAFMTRHFSPQLLKIASRFFESVEQSRAWKKSRLLILKGKKELPEKPVFNEVKVDESLSLQQYFGVFSANHIDPATRFLMDHLQTQNEKSVLDLASGNGILAVHLRRQNPEAEIHLVDDSFLAIESSKLNLTTGTNHFHYQPNLDGLPEDYFDLVVSNPPFHFEYEIDISISLSLFKEVFRCLKPGGRFVLVANRHLNYSSHLVRIFPSVDTLAENKKFVIYTCRKH